MRALLSSLSVSHVHQQVFLDSLFASTAHSQADHKYLAVAASLISLSEGLLYVIHTNRVRCFTE